MGESSADQGLKCLCGAVLTDSLDLGTWVLQTFMHTEISSYYFLGERAELKSALSKKYGCFKVKDIRSSKLWNDMQGGKKKEVEVLIVPANELKCSQRKGKKAWKASLDRPSP